MVLLKPFGDVVDRVPAATFLLIKEARPDATSDEGGDIDPLFTIILQRFSISAIASCCTWS